MSSAANKKFSRKRLIFLIGGISLFWLILEINLFRIQIVNNERYAKMAANQYLKKIPLPARRGLVLDCNGNQLISNTLHYDLAADPKLIKNKKRLAGICAARFNRSREYFLNRLKQKSRFVYLRRKVPYATIQPILKLNDAGIITPENFRREYPYGPYAAQLLGFTDPDDKGLSGLELQFDDILRGKDGNAVLQYDGPRRVFFNADNPIKRPDNGLNIQLTIDKNIQTVVDQELAEGVKNMRAKSGMAVVVDPYSGRVLAMANYPSFDPNRQQNYGQEVKRNRVITDVYEPGSTMKIITAAILLQERLKKRDDLVFCENGSFRLYNRTFSDTKKHGWLTLQGAVEKSSNIGIIKLSAAIDKNTMFRFLKNFGFGSKTGIGLIGEAEGSLLPPQKWNKITKASLSFGYGISVTTLQMAMAYAALANGGYAVQPVAIKRVEDSTGGVLLASSPPQGKGDPALDPRVAYLITDILSDDTARIPSFGEESVLKLDRPAAVKTGTTTDFRDNWTVGYTPDLVVGVWTGNADNEPMRDISGVDGAAPIWHDFMEMALRGRPARQFPRPDGLVEVEVCALSGLLPGPDCPHRVSELFLAGSEPTERCHLHQRIAIDRATGLRADETTPPERIVEKVYLNLPPEAKAWARERGLPQPPPTAETAAAAEGQRLAQVPVGAQPLLMAEPDAGAVYQLDPGLSREAQKIRVSARPAADAVLSEVTLLLDGRPLAHFGAPPYEVVWALEPGEHSFRAEGLTATGERVVSDPVRITVLP